MRSPISALPLANLETLQQGTLAFEWKGILCCKNPFDFALYSTLIWRQKPGTIIEIGTYRGGSALWFADLTRSYGLESKILSIDIDPFSEFSDPRIEFRQGDATQLAKVLSKAEMRELPRPLLVIEDANHHYETTIAVLRYFNPWMKPGEYIAVEDGIVDSFAVQDRYNGGPNRAISEFLSETNDRYEIDTSYCDYFGPNVTWNTNGYLRRRS